MFLNKNNDYNNNKALLYRIHSILMKSIEVYYQNFYHKI